MQISKKENMNVLCLQACGLARRQVGKYLRNLQINMLSLIKSNSKCLS